MLDFVTNCYAKAAVYGSFALDDGHYTVSAETRERLIAQDPACEQSIRPFIGGQELLHNERRFCLWLAAADPKALRACKPVLDRVEAVRKWRSTRDREATRKLAGAPTRFAEIRQPTEAYLAIPTLSSEKRRYIPIGMFDPDVIASNQIYISPVSTSWHFGILHSLMHMAWVKQVCGRRESRYRYSNAIVYNNSPWPEAATDKQRTAVEAKAQAVPDARAKFPGSSLADLCDPLTIPPALQKAHADLDRAVELCYRKEPFHGDRERVEFLFQRYETLTAPLTADLTLPSRRKRGPRLPD